MRLLSNKNYVTWQCNMKSIRVKEQIQTNGRPVEFRLVLDYIANVKGVYWIFLTNINLILVNMTNAVERWIENDDDNLLLLPTYEATGH